MSTCTAMSTCTKEVREKRKRFSIFQTLDESGCINLFVLTLTPYMSSLHVYMCTRALWQSPGETWQCALVTVTRSGQCKYLCIKVYQLPIYLDFWGHLEVSSNIKVKSVQTCITVLLSASIFFFFIIMYSEVKCLKLMYSLKITVWISVILVKMWQHAVDLNWFVVASVLNRVLRDF